MVASTLRILHVLASWSVPAGIGGLATLAALAWLRRYASQAGSQTLTRVATHLASGSTAKRTPAKSTALQRDIQEVFEINEATYDLEMLDRLLRDVRDLSRADEAIFWRWVETRQTLVPNAWSTAGEPRPAHFDMRAWSPLVRWCAEQGTVQFAGNADAPPLLAAARVVCGSQMYGVLTVTAASGLRLDREAARSWMPRFAAQVANLVQLFEIRREYGRHMRHSEALLDAVRRLHGHRNAEALAQALCDTARDVTSASVAGVVRWNAVDQHGVLQALSPSLDIEAGFHVTADSIVGKACTAKLPIVLNDARSAVVESCPYGGFPRTIGSLAVVPVRTGDTVIGAIVVEGNDPGDVSQHEARNVGLLAAVVRGPLEIVWEIEEVSRSARTDSLTRLANRRHFDEQLARVIAETDRFGGTCSLIFVDLDHFKAVNDRYGHEAGDAVLRDAAQMLSQAVRTVDLCARYGGEEIAILLPQTSQEGAVELAERLRIVLESRRVKQGDEAICITASFGVATYPDPVPYGDRLVPAADKALYEAKAAGRNCVRVIQAKHVTSASYKSR